MGTTIAPSNIFAGCSAPAVRASETAASFVKWNRRVSSPQNYRSERSATASVDTSLLSDVQELSSRISTIQKLIYSRTNDMACPGSIKSVSAEALVKLANEVAEIEQISAKPASRKPEHTAEFDSFAKFASEASRVR